MVVNADVCVLGGPFVFHYPEQSVQFLRPQGLVRTQRDEVVEFGHLRREQFAEQMEEQAYQEVENELGNLEDMSLEELENELLT